MTASRKPICGRDLKAGPGSCHYWWDTCPEKVGHCMMRFVEANRDLKEASVDEQEAALARWASDRDRARDPQPKLV